MMIRPTESTTQANTSVKTAWSAVGNLDAVGAEADKSAVVARLIEQVQTLLRESGKCEPFDAAAEFYLNTPKGEALVSSLIGAIGSGSHM